MKSRDTHSTNTEKMNIDPARRCSASSRMSGAISARHAVRHLHLAVLLLYQCWTFGQPALTGQPDAKVLVQLIQQDRVPSTARRYLAALGDRIVKPGRERSIGSGTISIGEGGQREDITWTREFPGKLRWHRGKGQNLVTFNPNKKIETALSELDEEIAEALSADTADEFFDKAQDGVLPRLLGSGFVLRADKAFGSAVDIFQVGIPVAARSKPGVTVKQFHFDSVTGLLSRVAYQKMLSGAMTPVNTEYSNYQVVDGLPTAFTITRFNGGKIRFQIDLTAAQWTAAVSDGLFP